MIAYDCGLVWGGEVAALQAIRRAATYGVEFGFTRREVSAQAERVGWK